MKALLLREYLKLEIVDAPMPEVGPDDVLIRVRACGICGSDVHGYDGSTGRRNPPLIMGHEAAGEIAQLGTQVTGFEVGERVTFDSTISCGKCRYCLSGVVNLCDNRQVLGVAPKEYRRHGAFAEYVSVPGRIVYKIPDSLAFEQAALIEAVSVGVHAAAITPIKSGDKAVVVGAGMIGLVTLQAVKASGCADITVIDPDETRLAVAKLLGATRTVNSSQLNTRDFGDADIVFECAGLEKSFATAIDCVRKGGVVTLIGNVAPTVTLPLQSVVTRQIRLQGSCASSGEYPRCIELMASGAIKVEPLISACAPLGDGPAWFERLYNHEPNLMKVVLTP